MLKSTIRRKNVPSGSAGMKSSVSNSKYGLRAIIQIINNSTNEVCFSFVYLGKLCWDTALVEV